MTPVEAQVLLGIAAAFDNRKPDADAAKAWSVALHGLRFEDCRDAIVAHYRASSDWLMPQRIVSEVKRIRSKRVADFGPIDPPPGFDPDDTEAYRRWLAGMVRAVADGTLTAPAALEHLAASTSSSSAKSGGRSTMRDHDACEAAIDAALARGDDGRALYLATRCDLVHGVIEAPVAPEPSTAEKVAALVHPDVARVRQYRGADSPVDHGRVRAAMRRFRPGQPLGWVVA